MTYEDFYKQSIERPEDFWREEAQRIDWYKPFRSVLDGSPPLYRWFDGGMLNLCHNAIDRHLAERADQPALIWRSTEVHQEKIYTFQEMHAEVQAMAACLLSLGVVEGDRVLIYLPMVPEAAFAMLACARIGAIHSVVFGGFASVSLCSRIDDAGPKVVISADAGSRAGKTTSYKPLLDQAIQMAEIKPEKVIWIDRGISEIDLDPSRDVRYSELKQSVGDEVVPCVPVESHHPSYILYTSGTTGRPKGVQRDTGGYAVALAASMRHIFLGQPGETFFATSDIGWVVGHSYIIYGPLIAGMGTIMYEGLPTKPHAGVWWEMVEKYKVTAMFSAPTAIRVLKKEGADDFRKHDTSSLRALFLAGEPLDASTSSWIAEGLGVPVIDNYWQTESGWPILTVARGIDADVKEKLGSVGLPMYGYRVKLVDEESGEDLIAPHSKGVLAIEGPLPPGFMQTVWKDDRRFLQTYWESIPGRTLYSTFDWGIRDEDGYFFILGRTDDVINVAGHRLGTREIEESLSSHPRVAESAVVGVKDAIKGQVAVAFVTLRETDLSTSAMVKLKAALARTVEQQLGAVARPAFIHFVSLLPKTRSGKIVRRTLQALAENRDPGDLSTIDDPAALTAIQITLGKA